MTVTSGRIVYRNFFSHKDFENKTSGTSLSKVEVKQTGMSMYAMHVYRRAQFECHSF